MSKSSTKKLREHEQFIISQAMMEIQSVNDIQRVIDKVEGTAVKVNNFAWKTFLDLVKLKKKMLESKGGNRS